MSRLVTISFTPLDARGGVPAFNRALHSAFPDRTCVHHSWWDFPWHIEMEHLPEWEKARALNHYLVAKRLVTADDVIVADGFWADGLDHLPLAVSHSHGIWSHLTKDDVDAGRVVKGVRFQDLRDAADEDGPPLDAEALASLDRGLADLAAGRVKPLAEYKRERGL